MRKIKRFNDFLIESLTEEELNELLDKINNSGIDSLSELELKELDNSKNDKFNKEIEGTRIILRKIERSLTKEEENFLNSFEEGNEKETFDILNKGYIDYSTYGNGDKKYETNYKNGLLHGESKHWDKEGFLLRCENYKMGKLHGEQIGYRKSYGNSIEHTSYYIDGKRVEEWEWDNYNR